MYPHNFLFFFHRNIVNNFLISGCDFMPKLYKTKNRIKSKIEKEQLTPEEIALAAQEHHVVYEFMGHKKLRIDEWYDIIVFGFLKAVRDWCREPQKYMKYRFDYIAHQRMFVAYAHELEIRSRNIDAISLDAPIKEYEDLTIGNIIIGDNIR